MIRCRIFRLKIWRLFAELDGIERRDVFEFVGCVAAHPHIGGNQLRLILLAQVLCLSRLINRCYRADGSESLGQNQVLLCRKFVLNAELPQR